MLFKRQNDRTLRRFRGLILYAGQITVEPGRPHTIINLALELGVFIWTEIP